VEAPVEHVFVVIVVVRVDHQRGAHQPKVRHDCLGQLQSATRLRLPHDDSELINSVSMVAPHRHSILGFDWLSLFSGYFPIIWIKISRVLIIYIFYQ
jgi:hypothetical protein